MSRTVPPDLTALLRKAAEKQKRTEKNTKTEPITITIPLKTITPVVGGGVESMTPDTVDHVRVQGIRGQLRWWWRALHPCNSAEELFRKETRIWGGVGEGVYKDESPDETSTKKSVDARKSLVTLEISKANAGNPDYRPLSNCGGGSIAQTYTLFPLSVGQGAQKPTRVNKTFNLTISIERRLPENQLKGVFATVTLWTLFSSIGARGTRGYGRFAIHDPQHLPMWNHPLGIDLNTLQSQNEVIRVTENEPDPLSLFENFRRKILNELNCRKTQNGSPLSLGNFRWAFLKQEQETSPNQRLTKLILHYKNVKPTFHLKNEKRFTSPLRFGCTYIAGEPFDYYLDTGESPHIQDLKNIKKDPRETYQRFFNSLTEESGWTLIGQGGSHDV